MVQSNDRNLALQDGLNEAQLIERLRQGDENAFMLLVESYQAAMFRIAEIYVRNTELAGEVVQETWIAVLQGIDRFEGRSARTSFCPNLGINRF